MKTKLLMISSALMMGITGFTLTFFPQEILYYAGTSMENLKVLILQMAGTLYISFAILNWMAKANLAGGIYSKPVALGNFAHFFMGALTLIKFGFSLQSAFTVWLIATIYFIFALFFGLVTFRRPESS